ncbi:3'-5' exonuclease family protein [Streptomyces mirabilis]|uniref:hypothetical protein n=1 Tax=Streptomyces mirabilis TaxID=68239 RepID=UPI0038118E7C
MSAVLDAVAAAKAVRGRAGRRGSAYLPGAGLPDEEIAAAQAADTWFTPRWCPPCKERDDREREEARQRTAALVAQAQQARREQVAGLEEWAGTVLADPDTVVLDTETTGLDGTARIIDLGILDVAGTTLMDRLLDPGGPVPTSATEAAAGPARAGLVQPRDWWASLIV